MINKCTIFLIRIDQIDNVRNPSVFIEFSFLCMFLKCAQGNVQYSSLTEHATSEYYVPLGLTLPVSIYRSSRHTRFADLFGNTRDHMNTRCNIMPNVVITPCSPTEIIKRRSKSSDTVCEMVRKYAPTVCNNTRNDNVDRNRFAPCYAQRCCCVSGPLRQDIISSIAAEKLQTIKSC